MLARRRRRVRLAVAAGALLFVASIAVRLERIAAPLPEPTPPRAQLDSTEARILELINAARVRAGTVPLAISDRLMIAARAHAADMAAHGYLAYEGAAGDTPVDRVRAAGLDYQELAENLLSDPGYDPATLPQRALTTWLASPNPRNHLLSPRFNRTAVAVAHATDGTYYLALDLMR